MVLFDHTHKIKKYSSVQEIIEEFYPIRLQKYAERIAYLIKVVKRELNVATNKYNFIKGVSTQTIVFKNLKKAQMVQTLKDHGFMESEDGDYDYLLRMPIWSLCEDKMRELEQVVKDKQEQLRKLESTKVQELWVQELDLIEAQFKQDLLANYSYQVLQHETSVDEDQPMK